MNDIPETHAVDDRGPDVVVTTDQGGDDYSALHPDLVEVANEKYHEKVAFILPLTSGRFAVLTPQRRLYQIVDTLEEAVGLAPAAYQAARTTWKREDEGRNMAAAKVLVSDDLLKELGL